MMTKKRSRIFALLLCGCMLLAGCQGGGAASGQGGEPSPGNSSVSEAQESAPSDSSPALSAPEGMRMVTDMRGKQVAIPQEPQRVAILDKGFLVQTMVAMGVEDTLVASGGLVQATSLEEERDSLTLCPAIRELPQIGYPTDAVDFEALAAAQPDLVLLCNSEYIKDSEITASAIKRIEEDLGYPLVVVNGPGCDEQPRLETLYEGIALLGEVFGRQERADEIVALLQEPINLVSERTAEIPEEERPTVMYIGLTGEDAVGKVWGGTYGDAKFSAEYAHIQNVYTEQTSTAMSAEQIIALRPEVMILCTNSVRPDPEILAGEQYASLREVPAVKNGRVTSLGLLTWWGDFRLEAPTILLIAAKSAYPEQFADIKVGEWLNQYHQALYGLSEEEAQHLKVVQQLDWMDGRDF